MDLPASLCDGRYTLIDTLGSGGMATVYRAYDHRLKVWRAMKLLSAEFGRKKKLRARFDSEAHAMAVLEHPNIVRVYDVGVEGNQPYIVMELCEGGSPIDWLETHGAMPPRLATQVVLQLCEGIGAAHAGGVIHRDIKPHNVLVTSKGVCKVTDFGIARMDDSDVQSALTKTGSVMGTLGFMAPEQRLDSKGVDVRADVYAIGATLYTLLTAQTNMDLFAAEQDDEVLAGVHPALRPIVVRATQYKREQRYPDAAALIAALEEAFPSLPRDPPGTPPLVMPTSASPPVPQAPTLAPMTTAEPTVSVEVGPPEPGRSRLVPRGSTGHPAAERSLANMPFPKAEARRGAPRAEGEVGGPEAPIAARAAQMLASSDAVPDYQVVAPAAAAREAYPIDLAAGEKQQQGGDGEDPEEGEGEGANVGGDGAQTMFEFALQIVILILKGLAQPAKLLAGPFTIFGGLFVVMLGFGSARVNDAQTYAVQTGDAYAMAADADLAEVVGIVIEAGGSEIMLVPALAAYEHALTDEERIAAADLVVDALREQLGVPKVATQVSQMGSRGRVDQAMYRLNAVQREHHAAHEAWVAATESTQGRYAVGCHAAEAPPSAKKK